VTAFGVRLPIRLGPSRTDWLAAAVELASAAEQSGFSSVWLADPCPSISMAGAVTPPGPESYTLLGALATCTSRVELGALVSDVACRHPSVLAKTVTTLDVITSGRAVLGIGATPPPGAGAETGSGRLGEAVEICRAMFTHDDVSFAGTHYRLQHARNLPLPVRTGGPRILIDRVEPDGVGPDRGGPDDNLQLIAGLADSCLLHGDADSLARTGDDLRRLCEQRGRDPATLGLTWSAPCILLPDSPAGSQVGPTDGTRPAQGIHPADGTVIGRPYQLPELIADHLAAGADEVIFSFDAVDTGALAELGAALGLDRP
jgi:alkanesulfonate monooxygenase SsuD/methylene tetrahydromethanopterin reductase-like flavin-dependent oxidoreductase (luciferase family)